MIAKTYSVIPCGFEASPIEIEGALSHGLPCFNIVGMGSRTVSESRERIKSALKSSGFSFPDQKLTINLAPADQEKDGTFLDLPIAINILILSSQLRQVDTKNTAFVGELSLDGNLRPIAGIINIVETAKKLGVSTLFLPRENYPQAKVISGIRLVAARNLSDIYLHLKDQTEIKNPKNVVKNTKTDITPLTFDQIKGQSITKRALTIAIAGRHNILLSGPPGTGKTMLARASLSLLPPPTLSEKIAITKLHSLTGTTDSVVAERPFRTPHHTCSLNALVGGGTKATPGEISLAHLGVLFMDELPEFPRAHLESLRQPLEDRTITVSRTKYKVTYPADFMLIATQNPCPCGYLGDPQHECTCTETQIRNYQKKLSGPLLDRIDLFVDVDRISPSSLTTPSVQSTDSSLIAPNVQSVGSVSTTSRPQSTNSALAAPRPHSADPVRRASIAHSIHPTTSALRAAIKTALAAESRRFKNNHTYNSSASPSFIEQNFYLSSAAKDLLDSAADRLNLSARSYFKIIKISRTIADLESSPEISKSHLAEALTFRQK